MILTRGKIQNTFLGAREYLFLNKDKIEEIGRYMCRQQPVKLRLDREFKIELVYDDDSYWAMTDGETIWLNMYKEYDDDLLFFTLLHEMLHGLVIRGEGNYELSELREHNLMGLLDSRLI